MIDYNKMLNDLIDEARIKYPGFNVIRKKDSLLMKAIGGFLRLVSFGKMDRFDRFFTTVYKTVYTGSRWDLMDSRSKYLIMVHELKHIDQMYRCGLGSPVLGFIVHGGLYLFAWLPIGLAYFRMIFEAEAYAVDTAEELKLIHKESGSRVEFENGLSRGAYLFKVFQYPIQAISEDIADYLTGPSYLWAWHSRKGVKEKFMYFIKRALLEDDVK